MTQRLAKFSIFNSKFSIREGGFTIVELIVVLSILAILGSFGIAGFVAYSRSQTLAASANDLATMLNLAKSRASSQLKPSQCAGQSLDSYQVRICQPPSNCISTTTPAPAYELDVQCGGNVISPPITNSTMPNNVSFSSPPVNIFYFPIIKGVVLFYNGSIALTGTSYSIPISGFSKTKTVIIDQSGNTRIQ